MATEYCDGESIKSIAERIIATHHPELALAQIKYVFRDSATKKGGRTVHGSVKKLAPLWKYITECDFLMEVALESWNVMQEATRFALVDHLLERCTGEEVESEDDDTPSGMKWKLREPDVHEFANILRRHGAWNEDLAGFVSVAQSINLSFMTADPASPQSTVN